MCQPVACSPENVSTDNISRLSVTNEESQEKVPEIVQKVKWYEKFLISSSKYVKEENASPLLKEKNRIFHQLYAKYSTREASYLSLKDRQQYSSCFPSSSSSSSSNSSSPLSIDLLPVSSMSSLTYGELQDVYSLQTLFFVLLKNGLLPLAGKGRFYDLGSGTGRVLIAAYLLYPFQDYVGIEILPSLVNVANEVKEELIDSFSRSWKREIINDYSELMIGDTGNILNPDRSHPKISSSFLNIHFFLGSILVSSEQNAISADKNSRVAESNSSLSNVASDLLNWSKYGDVVFINSTCFDDHLMEEISSHCANLKSGSVVITLTRTLTTSVAKCDLIHELRLDMSW
jgi:SAM-dependent methyltransferase